MSKAIENLQAAQQRAMAIRPKVGGFPYLAEALRQAGVTRNLSFTRLPEFISHQGRAGRDARRAAVDWHHGCICV